MPIARAADVMATDEVSEHMPKSVGGTQSSYTAWLLVVV